MNSTSHAFEHEDTVIAAYELARLFDACCRRAGASYFAVGDTLVGAVVYGGFIPGGGADGRGGADGDADGRAPQVVEVGMLRGEFEKLARMFAQGGDGFDGLSAMFKPGEDPCAVFRRRCARGDERVSACGAGDERAAAGDGQASGGASLECADGSCVKVSVYDELTDDYDLTRFQLHRIRKLRAAAGRLRDWAAGMGRAMAARAIWRIAGKYDGCGCGKVANLVGGSDREVPIGSVAWTRRIGFGGASIAVPVDTRAWIESDADEMGRRTALVQADALRIAAEIDRICGENGIGYFICAGTLLGAVRYKGFIPWDDDIDIGMLRPDYDRFLDCAASQLGSEFFLQTRATDPCVPYLYAKVRLRGTEYVTPYTEHRNMNKGISVDIFPFDPAPVGAEEFEGYRAHAEQLAKRHKTLAIHQVPEDMPRRRARGLSEVVGHAVMAAHHARYRRQSTADTESAYLAHVTKYAGCETEFAASYVEYFTCIPFADLLPYRRMEFAGLQLLAPNNPDPLLKMQFGDYRTEPPEHKRRGHQIITWQTSTGAHGPNPPAPLPVRPNG